MTVTVKSLNNGKVVDTMTVFLSIEQIRKLEADKNYVVTK